MAVKVLKREFSEWEKGKFNVVEERESSFEVDPIAVITQLGNVKWEIDKVVDDYPKMIESIKVKISNYNQDVEFLRLAKEELKFDVVVPENIDVDVVLSKLK